MKNFGDFRIEIPGGRSGEVAVTCPECSSSRKKKNARCLSVNVEKGVWNCAHCGWKGTLQEGARKADELHWRKPTYRRPEPQVEDPNLPARTLEWFAKRGLGEPVIRRNRIFRASTYMPQTEQHEEVVAFPYYRANELINVKYRDKDKNFRSEVGCERLLYGIDDLSKTTIICEGEIDKLSFEQCGLLNCVSVPDGAPAPGAKDLASKLSYLEDDRLEVVDEWIIATDGDAPGRYLSDELCRRFGADRCKRVVWPQGCKDANEVLVAHGAEALRSLVEKAEPFPIEGIIEPNDLADELDDLYDQGVTRGLSTGWPVVDELYTVRPGELTIVTGIPNSGKSNWVDALTMNLSKAHGWRFAVFSPENQPTVNHLSRLIEHYAEFPFRDGPTQRMSRKDVEVCRDFVQGHFRFVLPNDEQDWSLEEILVRVKSLVRRFGINGLVIDPWNEMEHQRDKNQSETEFIGSCLKRLRQFARRNKIHIWLVAHPAKLYRNKDDGNYPVPTLYDISGSAHFRNKADCGIVVWRNLADHQDPNVDIHIQKIRFREVGHVGQATLKYIPATGGYENYAKPKLVPPREKARAEGDWWDK